MIGKGQRYAGAEAEARRITLILLTREKGEKKRPIKMSHENQFYTTRKPRVNAKR